jgi:hypothetical protein
MRTLTVSVPVAAPSAFTAAFLPSYFQGEIGERGLRELFLRYSLPNVTMGLSIDRRVSIEVRQGKSIRNDAALDISWSAKGTAAFPRYSGTFSADPSGTTSCTLQLQGRYSAPGGALGRAFDAIAGRHIARATIAAFLSQIARAAERDYDVRMAM